LSASVIDFVPETAIAENGPVSAVGIVHPVLNGREMDFASRIGKHIAVSAGSRDRYGVVLPGRLHRTTTAMDAPHTQRTGTPFNHLEFPTEIVFQVVTFRLLFKLSLRDLVRMFLMRGYEFTHETVRDWEERFPPLIAEQLRRNRKGRVGRRWYVDETYLKVKGKWCYLYRAIDRDGNLVDSLLSATRDTMSTGRKLCFRRHFGNLFRVGAVCILILSLQETHLSCVLHNKTVFLSPVTGL
jgi:hypothetical protein